MVGVPKLPRINPGTALNNPHLAGVIPSGERAGFARLAGEALWKLERKYDVDLAKCFGRGRFRLASPLNALAILNWRREGGPCRVAAVELASRRDLLAAFVKSPGVFFLPPSPAPDFSAEAYLAALAGVRVCEVTGGVDSRGRPGPLLARLAAGLAMGIAVRVSQTRLLPDPHRLLRHQRAPEVGPRLLFFSGGSALGPLSRRLVAYTHNSIHLVTTFDSAAPRPSSAGPSPCRRWAICATGSWPWPTRACGANPAIHRLFAQRLPGGEPPPRLRERLEALVRGRDPCWPPSRSPAPDHPPLLGLLPRRHAGGFRPGRRLPGQPGPDRGLPQSRRHLDPVVFLFSKLAEVRGTVRPITNQDLHLAAELADGTLILGQHRLTGKEVPPIAAAVRRLALSASLDEFRPVRSRLREEARALIARAELICFPLGSFFSSVLAQCLLVGVGAAIAQSGVPKVFIPNLARDPELVAEPVERQAELLLQYLQAGGRAAPGGEPFWTSSSSTPGTAFTPTAATAAAWPNWGARWWTCRWSTARGGHIDPDLWPGHCCPWSEKANHLDGPTKQATRRGLPEPGPRERRPSKHQAPQTLR